MREPIFVINAGSSSVKFSVYRTASDRSVEAGAHGQVEGIGTAHRLKVADVQGRVLADQVVGGKDYAGAIAEIHDWFSTYVGSEAALHGIGHRVVHGGNIYFRPVMIDERVIADLDELVPLAPLHQPHHIAAIRAFRQHRTRGDSGRLL
jgi:acetate kinase